MPPETQTERVYWTRQGRRGPLRLTLLEDRHGKSIDLRRWYDEGGALKPTGGGVRIRAADDVDGLIEALRTALEAMRKASDT